MPNLCPIYAQMRKLSIVAGTSSVTDIIFSNKNHRIILRKESLFRYPFQEHGNIFSPSSTVSHSQEFDSALRMPRGFGLYVRRRSYNGHSSPIRIKAIDCIYRIVSPTGLRCCSNVGCGRREELVVFFCLVSLCLWSAGVKFYSYETAAVVGLRKLQADYVYFCGQDDANGASEDSPQEKRRNSCKTVVTGAYEEGTNQVWRISAK